MNPEPRAAGTAGMLAGAGLAIEFALFTASGWTPATFSQPERALAFLQTGGTLLRAAGLVGFLNLGLAVLWVVGLAAKLADGARTRATATLYFALVGMAGHALVPVGLWLTVPAFLRLAAHDQAVAAGGWSGFAALLSAAGGVGYLFDGFALLAAGWALLGRRRWPALLGWVGVVGGGASALTVLADETALDALAAACFLPALLLTITFRFWSGYLLRRETGEAREHRPAEATPSATKGFSSSARPAG
ncbi:MAG TPA: DUF4386 family protein [Gemmatimonadaceae bacterium]